MTKEEKQTILDLRAEGKSYGEIATITGIKEASIKTICFRAKNKRIEEKYYCKECGKPLKFTLGKRIKIYCDYNCRMKYWSKHKDDLGRGNLILLECPNCHKTFFSYKSKNAKYCSLDCYQNSRKKVAIDEE